ncbi:hypothetical protein Mterra_03068 [Calidithermus terrae]|uniref:Uncharacterized protein n=1 Tax=Calidithermus terrae TaxID=1408545 RepID=A0A399EH50_9DEIN|nr:hypothetical protein [Calidithermus terrae]RIH81592.1 hypothetical protein Mterra_03068 [Calidithermus terrae]
MIRLVIALSEQYVLEYLPPGSRNARLDEKKLVQYVREQMEERLSQHFLTPVQVRVIPADATLVRPTGETHPKIREVTEHLLKGVLETAELDQFVLKPV